MDSYYDPTFKLLASVGLRISKERDGILFGVIKLPTIVFLFITILQELFFIVLTDKPASEKICDFPCIMLASESIIEVFTILWHRKRIAKVLSELDLLFAEMSEVEKKNFVQFITKYRKVAIYFGIMALSCVSAFNLLPIVRVLYAWYVHGMSIRLYPFFFWWPFDSLQYFASTYIYEIYCGHLTVTTMVAAIQFFVLIVAQIVAHSNHLGSKLKTAIEKFQSKEITLQAYESNVKAIIENHCKLISYSNQITDMFGFVCFAIVSLGSIIICFTGFALLVSWIKI